MMKMLMMWLAALALIGCGDPLSNQLLLEDDLYRRSLPVAEDLATDAPRAEEARDLGDRAEMVTTTIAVSTRYNSTIFALLGIIDGVLDAEVSRREENLRMWGPWAGRRSGSSLRVVVSRGDEGLFSYALQVADVPRWAIEESTEWRDLMLGVFVRGASLREGTGEFVFDADQWGTIDGRFANAGGQLRVSHARVGERVAIDSVTDGWTSDGEEIEDALYSFRGGDRTDGFFEYETTGDVVGEGGANERYVIRSRWNEDLTGRADFEVTGGEFGNVFVPGSECWNGGLERTYFVIDPVGTQFDVEEGNPADCVLEHSQPGSEPPAL